MDVHSRVSVNSICSIQQSLIDDVSMWQELGIDQVGLILHKVEAAGWDDATSMLRSASLRVATVAGPVPVPLDTDPHSDEFDREESVLRRAVDFAVGVGAGSMYLCSGSPGSLTWEQAAAVFRAHVSPVVAYARDAGLPLAIEPTNPLRADVSFVYTLRDAIDLARAAELNVVVDFQSCWYERGLADLIANNLDVVGLVQVSDYVIGTFDTPNRAVPGDGQVPVERLIALVLDAGYAGPFDLEVIGPRVEAEGYRGAVARSVEVLSEMLFRLGA